jgi:hypothetical protein
VKKFFSIAFSLLILLSTTGFTLIREFCPMMGKTTYSLINSGKMGCGCTDDDGTGCCKRNTIEIKKIEDEFTAAPSTVPPPEYCCFISTSYDHPLSFTKALYGKFFYQSFYPPGKLIRLPVLLQSFLF